MQINDNDSLILSGIFGLAFWASGGTDAAHTAGAYDSFIEASFAISLFITSLLLNLLPFLL